MNINFKSILIIFLVAMLGAGVGTFGVLELFSKEKMPLNQKNMISKYCLIVLFQPIEIV